MPKTKTKTQLLGATATSAAISPETRQQVERIAALAADATRKGELASRLVEACNHVVGVGAIAFNPTPQAEAAVRASYEAHVALNEAYEATRATPDLPEPILIEVLRVRLNTQGDKEWCARIRALGGPAISPQWVGDYLMSRLLGRGTRIDGRVRRALILEDTHQEA